MPTKKSIKGIKPIKSLKQLPGVPILISSNGEYSEINTQFTEYTGWCEPGNAIYLDKIKVTKTINAIVQVEIECKVTAGEQMQVLVVPTNQGTFAALNNEAVLTTSPKYETRFHMAMYHLPAGENTFYLKWRVSGGMGYIRYRFCTVIVTT
jgi:hypothetical protein